MNGDKQSNRAHRPAKAPKQGPGKGNNPKVRRLISPRSLARPTVAPSADLGHVHAVSQAFISSSFRRAEKQARRNVEKDQTRLHVPAVDRTFNGTAGQGGKGVEQEVPPVIVAVMGPSGVRPSVPLPRPNCPLCPLTAFPVRVQVGKTTLIRSLVRRYTKNTMVDIKGPVTVVSGAWLTAGTLEALQRARADPRLLSPLHRQEPPPDLHRGPQRPQRHD